PAFVVNGNSFEADLPFLAFWMCAIALFVKGVDENAGFVLVGAGAAGAMAGLAAYQAVLLTPILALYLVHKKRISWFPAWLALLAAPVALGLWQLTEVIASGAVPTAMLAGYQKTYGLHSLASVWRNAVALTVHSGWVISPVLAIAAFANRW